MNSRAKGARGERQWRDELRANGYDARRGQQFSGSPDSPDVVCADLPWVHFEVKAVQRLNIEDAMEQARRDGGGKVPIVAHKRNHRPWLVTMGAEKFFKLLRGELVPDTSPLPNDSVAPAPSALSGPSPAANSFRQFPTGSSPQSGEGGRATGGPDDYLGCGRSCGQDGEQHQQRNTDTTHED